MASRILSCFIQEKNQDNSTILQAIVFIAADQRPPGITYKSKQERFTKRMAQPSASHSKSMYGRQVKINAITSHYFTDSHASRKQMCKAANYDLHCKCTAFTYDRGSKG